jgi:acetylornithine deacetylase/succinyl-diaminopimelate desuccinylase-like protein
MRSGAAAVMTAALVCGTLDAQAPDWEALQKEAVGLLQQYVRLDTSNPPGDTRKTADFVSALLEREGIAVTRYESEPGKAIVLARLRATGPPRGKAILLEHHMDVVPADRAQWKVDPFAAQIVDGEIWGRGALDMKSLGIMHLLAFMSLKRERVPLGRDVILMAVPDEETGGVKGAQWMIEHHYAELDPEYVLDEGGFGSRDLFAPGKLVFGISVAEKKRMWLKLRVEGVAGHGSQPHDQNANDRLVRALARLLAEPLPGGDVAILNTMRERIGPMAANKFTNAIQHSTIALTTLRSGVGEPPKVNVIPSVAEATLDCRVLPGTTGDEWIRELGRRLGDPAVKIEIINQSDDPVVTPQDTPMFRALAAAIERHHPGATVSPVLVPYGTDANSYRPRGVKSYGIAPVAVSADVVASMHSDAEHVPVAELAKGTRILFEALREVAAAREP